MSSAYDPSSWRLKTARIRISPESTFDAASGIALLESELEAELGNGFRARRRSCMWDTTRLRPDACVDEAEGEW